jgi:L-seryl-tRNA(Ser) seleniumtransferase
LSSLGLPPEPVVARSLEAGADLVLFSGDKLLGGPQCGVLLGKAELIQTIRKSPLARAMRIDKLTIAALQATLEIYLDDRQFDEIPVLWQLFQPTSAIQERARRLREAIRRADESLAISVNATTATVGGGSIPTAELPSFALALRSKSHSTDELACRLRTGQPPVISRVEKDVVLIDLRTVLPGDEADLVRAIEAV